MDAVQGLVQADPAFVRELAKQAEQEIRNLFRKRKTPKVSEINKILRLLAEENGIRFSDLQKQVGPIVRELRTSRSCCLF
jgi:hypothetical protein